MGKENGGAKVHDHFSKLLKNESMPNTALSLTTNYLTSFLQPQTANITAMSLSISMGLGFGKPLFAQCGYKYLSGTSI